jgi:transcriptional regulator GlxA family with amidase domain
VLAERVGMSHRHFVRRFTDEVAMSPARWIAAVRIDAARHELERTDDTVDVVARRCGFGTAETLRRSFHRHLGVGPDAYRARFSHQPSSTHPAQHPDADHRHADQPRPHPRSQSHPQSHPRHEDIA